MLPILAALIGGAVAALLVLAAFWAGGLIGEQQAAQPAVSPAQFDNVAANVGDLTARVARVESAAAKSPPPAPAPDPTLAGRTEAVERSLAAVREEVGRVNGQLRTITASLNELKTMPRDGAVAAAPDLGPLNERLKQLEDATRTLAADRKGAADDINVRRLVAANTLDAAVRRGEPFAAALAVAKQVAADPNSLAALDAFAARGIPPEATYLRDIVPVLQRLADGNAAKAKSAGAESPPGPASWIACSRASQSSCGSSGTRDRPPRLPPQPARLRCAARTWPRPEKMSPTSRRRPIRRSRPGSSRWMRARRRLRPRRNSPPRRWRRSANPGNKDLATPPV